MNNKLFFLMGAILVFSSVALACTDFTIKAKDGTVVVGRSMEFPIDLHSEIWVVPRGGRFEVVNKAGVKGCRWTAKYGFMGINAFRIKDSYVEAMNEKGLAIDGLMFTGAVYQPVAAGKYVPLDKIAAWTMGNFATVAEVKKALAETNVAASELAKIKDMGLHLAFHDAAGNNLVVEFIDGQAKLYDNPLGVMTNRPEFDWQLNNLRNYINLDSHDKKPRQINGVKIEPTGVGNGLLGLPGDWTPPSRFVRASFCLDAAIRPKNAREAVNLAEHILNVVDIPKGVIKESTPLPSKELYGLAQWVIIKDLTNKILYYKTYDNTAWKSVDLKKIDLSAGAPSKSLTMADKEIRIIDVSGQLR